MGRLVSSSAVALGLVVSACLGRTDGSNLGHNLGLTPLPTLSDWSDAVSSANALTYDGDDLDASAIDPTLRATLGNGYVASPIGSTEMFVAGVFNGEQTSDTPSHRASIPSPLNARITSGDAVGAALDLKGAAFYRYTSDATMVYYVHRARSSCMVMEVEPVMNASGEADGATTVTLQSDMTVESDDLVNIQLNTTTAPNGMDILVLTATTATAESGADDVVDVAVVTSYLEPGAATKLTFDGAERKTFLTAVRTGADSESPLEDALADFLAAAEVDSNELRTAHEEAWRELTGEAGIEIAGRHDVAVAVNSSYYYLLSSVREDVPHGLSPGGLASNGYNGHSFWDTETWMYPPLLGLFPDIGRSLLTYRVQRIPEAKLKALSYDPPYAGAMFPWESAASGLETCPTWADTGQLEQHISGDIVSAAELYYRSTGDTSFLIGDGLALASSVAEFLVSRVRMDDEGVAHIDHVIPPDEYATGDDSVYTNYVSKTALLFATLAAETAEPGSANPMWNTVADALLIPFDDALGIHPEYVGYAGDQIKQADVVLLGYPLNMNMSTEVRAADLAYYEPLTDDDGPAMTWGMHAVGHLELDGGVLSDKTASLFNRSFANVQAPWGVWTETPTGGAVNFLTGAGGFLQTVLYGFPGLRFDADLLRLANPTLIEGSSHMKVRGLAYRGARFDIAFGTEVAANSGTNAQLSVTLSSRSPGGSGFVVSNEETGEAVALAAEGDSASFDFAADASAYTIAEA